MDKVFVGPYESWMLYGKGRHYAPAIIRDGEAEFMSALAECPEGYGVEETNNVQDVENDFWLPTLWRPEPEFRLSFIPLVSRRKHDRNIFSTLGKGEVEEILERFLKKSNTSGLVVRLSFPVEAGTFSKKFLSGTDWTPDEDYKSRVEAGQKRHKPNIVAVIDDGIPFAHRNFRDSGGKTRIEFCWLQSALSEAHSHVLFGREFTREKINDLIAVSGSDEDVLYRRAGAIREDAEVPSSLGRRTSHGGHILDILAGNRKSVGSDIVEDDVRIIAVELPNTITWDTSGFGKDMYMLSAFHYIFDRAEIISKGYENPNLSLIINFSYGISGGPHDGTSQLEAAIDELVSARNDAGKPTALVMPAGNMFAEAMHGVVTDELLESGSFAIPWRVQPNDRTSTFVELWFPKDVDVKGYEISIHAPDSCDEDTIASLAIGETKEELSENGDLFFAKELVLEGNVIGQLSFDQYRRKRWRVMIALAPTEPENPTLPRGPAGLWQITISRGAQPLGSEGLQCWIQRDTNPAGYVTGARQSYFDDPNYVRYRRDGSLEENDSNGAFVRRFGSLSGLATGKTALVVGGFVESTGHPAVYSSAGRLEHAEGGKLVPCGKQVACSASSDRTPVSHGIVAAGTRSGSHAILVGTSSAAPQVARRLSQVLKNDGALPEDLPEQLPGTLPPDGGRSEMRLGKRLVRPERAPR